MFCCFLLFPRGRAFGELKIHVLHISLLIIAMIFSLFQERRAPLGGFRFIVFFSFDSASCSDHSHSQRDGNSRLLFLQLVIPKFADIWGNSDYYPRFQLLPTGRVPSTSYDQSSQRNKCLLGISRFMCVQLFWLF